MSKKDIMLKKEKLERLWWPSREQLVQSRSSLSVALKFIRIVKVQWMLSGMVQQEEKFFKIKQHLSVPSTFCLLPFYAKTIKKSQKEELKIISAMQ